MGTVLDRTILISHNNFQNFKSDRHFYPYFACDMKKRQRELKYCAQDHSASK